MSKRRIPSRVFTILVYLFLYAPIALLIIFSFNSGRSNRVWEGFSLQWYLELFQDTRLLGALRTTLILSVLAALIATILGTAAAIGFYSMRRRSRSVCLSVNNIPLTLSLIHISLPWVRTSSRRIYLETITAPLKQPQK